MSIPPLIHTHVFEEFFSIGDLDIQAIDQDHYTCISQGFRFGDFAYSTDVVRLDDNALKSLEGIKVWIVDGGGYDRKTGSTHASISQVIEWVEHLKPEITYLTDLTTFMDYDSLCAELPPHIRPAYDGLILNI